MGDQATQRDALLRLGEVLKARTGISLKGLRSELILGRLRSRLKALRLPNVSSYVHRLETDMKETEKFVNLMTTNHTYFFREKPHLDFLESVFLPRFCEDSPRELNIWCAACSTGEEAYTIAMIVDRYLSQIGSRCSVRISATDINTETLRLAQNAVYPASRLQNVPAEFRSGYFKQGRYPHEKFFRIEKRLTDCVKFSPFNLIAPVTRFTDFDLIMCRNVLIYFEPAVVGQVVRYLRKLLKPDGVLISGMSEQIDHHVSDMELLGRSIHIVDPKSRYRHSASQLRRVQDSKLAARPSWRGGLAAGNATKLVAEEKRKTRTSRSPPGSVSKKPDTSVIAIGASTGGIEALGKVLRKFSQDAPAIVVAQHFSANFPGNLANTLGRGSALTVVEAKDGMPLEVGKVIVAPGKAHLRVHRLGDRLVCLLVNNVPNCRFRPCVDVLFSSLAKIRGISVAAAVLTGMGSDGAEGALKLRAAGHRVFTQERRTSAVSGMPAATLATGAAEGEVPLFELARVLIAGTRRIGRSRAKKVT